MKNRTDNSTVRKATSTESAPQRKSQLDPASAISDDGFDLNPWIQSVGLEVEKPKPIAGGQRFSIPICPWNSSHNAGNAYISQFHDGTVEAGCSEKGCEGKCWLDLRDQMEPGWRKQKENSVCSSSNSSPKSRERATRPGLSDLERQVSELKDRDTIEDWALTHVEQISYLHDIELHKFMIKLNRLGLSQRFLATLERNAKTLVKNRTEVKTRTPADSEYVVVDDRIQHRIINGEGPTLRPLCNFTARIADNVIESDGQTEIRQMSIEGILASGETLQTITVPATKYEKMGWPVEYWGAKARVEPGRGIREHLRNAIQVMSHDTIIDRRVFTHTGWLENDGDRVFLSANGVEGREDVEVSLPIELQRYQLPETSENSLKGMQASLRLLEIGPKTITYPLWASMYAAPLAEIAYPAFVLFLVGPSGSKKSTLAALALNHFGEFSDTELPCDWLGTANSIERILFQAKDVPLVIDDYNPSADANQNRMQEAALTRVIRHVGNRQGRSRLRSDSTLMETYRPRCLVITTGEQGPSVRSTVARTVLLELQSASIDTKRLTLAQKESFLYAHGMKGYLEHVGHKWSNLQKELPRVITETRSRFYDQKMHARLPGALAILYAGADQALRYAESINVLDERAAERHRKECIAALLELGIKQSEIEQMEKPSELFLTTLVVLLVQRKLNIGSKDASSYIGGCTSSFDKADYVGWHDDSNIFLLPAAYHSVVQYFRNEGRAFPSSELSLRKELDNDGYLIRTQEKELVSKARDPRQPGKSKRVLKLRIEDLFSFASDMNVELPIECEVS